jgi:hypothetical protein
MGDPSRASVQPVVPGSSVLAAVRDPVVVFLLLAGFFDGLAGNAIHSILLFSTAIALGRDAALRRRGVRTRERATEAWDQPTAPWSIPLAVVGGVAYAAVFGSFGRYSWPVTLGVLVLGAMALLLAWNGPIRIRPEAQTPVERFGAVAWSSVFVGASLWELVALFSQPSLTTDSQTHPTISVLTDPLLASHPGRSIGLFLWLAFGYYLVQR